MDVVRIIKRNWEGVDEPDWQKMYNELDTIQGDADILDLLVYAEQEYAILSKAHAKNEARERELKADEDTHVSVTELKSLWEPIFGQYPRLAKALDKSPISQISKGRRRFVGVLEFTRWIKAIRAVGASSGINPADSSTWTDEVWHAVAREFANHQRILDEKRQEKGFKDAE